MCIRDSSNANGDAHGHPDRDANRHADCYADTNTDVLAPAGFQGF